MGTIFSFSRGVGGRGEGWGVIKDYIYRFSLTQSYLQTVIKASRESWSISLNTFLRDQRWERGAKGTLASLPLFPHFLKTNCFTWFILHHQIKNPLKELQPNFHSRLFTLLFSLLFLQMIGFVILFLLSFYSRKRLLENCDARRCFLGRGWAARASGTTCRWSTREPFYLHG